MTGDNTARKRIARCVFGTEPHIFTLDELAAQHLELFGVALDRDEAEKMLGDMTTAGYLRHEDDRFGVVMLPLDIATVI